VVYAAVVTELLLAQSYVLLLVLLQYPRSRNEVSALLLRCSKRHQ
jgi:hypothetical protein